jgi:hypothetical protein
LNIMCAWRNNKAQRMRGEEAEKQQQATSNKKGGEKGREIRKKRCNQKQQKKETALTGNRTRATRVAGGYHTTRP